MADQGSRRPGPAGPPPPAPLDWDAHFRLFCFPALISFLAVTLIVVLAGLTGPQDQVSIFFRHLAITAIQVITVIVVQSLFDMQGAGKGTSLATTMKQRANMAGIGRPGNIAGLARDTALLLFCALVPLDFITYIIPGILPYMASSPVGLFFQGFSPVVFWVVAPAYNIVTGIREEFIFRGYMTGSMATIGKRFSAWSMAAVLFGLMHVSFGDLATVPGGAAIWGGSALAVGLLFGGYFIARRRLLPLVLAHGLGNLISSYAIWVHHDSLGAVTTALDPGLLLFYVPMLMVGAGLACVCFNELKQAKGFLKSIKDEVSTTARAGDWLLVIALVLVFWVFGLFFIV